MGSKGSKGTSTTTQAQNQLQAVNTAQQQASFTGSQQDQQSAANQAQQQAQNTAQQQSGLSSYNANPLIGGAAQQALTQAQQAAATPFNLPVAPVAGFTPDQLQAFAQTQQQQGIAQPYYNQAQNLYNQSAAPISSAQINQYLNPYASNVLANLQESQGQQMNDITGRLQQQSGGVGGDRIGVAQAELARQQNLATGQTMAGLYGNALSAAQQDAQRQQASAYGIGNLGGAAQNAAMQGTQALLGQGGLQQQLAQAQLNAPYQNTLAQLALPYQQAQYLAGVTGGLAGPLGGTTATSQQGTGTSAGSSYGTSNNVSAGNTTSAGTTSNVGSLQGIMQGFGTGTSTPAPPSWASQIAGLGTAGAGVVGALNSAGAFSARGGRIEAARGGRIGYADGGYLPWMNYDPFTFPPNQQASVQTPYVAPFNLAAPTLPPNPFVRPPITFPTLPGQNQQPTSTPAPTQTQTSTPNPFAPGPFNGGGGGDAGSPGGVTGLGAPPSGVAPPAGSTPAVSNPPAITAPDPNNDPVAAIDKAINNPAVTPTISVPPQMAVPPVNPELDQELGINTPNVDVVSPMDKNAIDEMADPPAEKGEPTAAQDAAALAAANQTAINEGFMGVNGVPGPNTTTTSQSISSLSNPSSPVSMGFNGFAPSPPGVVGVAPPAQSTPAQDTTAQALADQASTQAAIALGLAQAQDMGPSPEATTAPTPGPMGMIGDPVSAPTGINGLTGVAPAQGPTPSDMASIAANMAAIAMATPSPTTGFDTPGVTSPTAPSPTQAQTDAAVSSLAQGMNQGMQGFAATDTPGQVGLSAVTGMAPGFGLSGLTGDVADDATAAANAATATMGDPTGISPDTGISVSDIGDPGTGTATNADGSISGVSVGDVGDAAAGDAGDAGDGGDGGGGGGDEKRGGRIGRYAKGGDVETIYLDLRPRMQMQEMRSGHPFALSEPKFSPLPAPPQSSMTPMNIPQGASGTAPTAMGDLSSLGNAATKIIPLFGDYNKGGGNEGYGGTAYAPVKGLTAADYEAGGYARGGSTDDDASENDWMNADPVVPSVKNNYSSTRQHRDAELTPLDLREAPQSVREEIAAQSQAPRADFVQLSPMARANWMNMNLNPQQQQQQNSNNGFLGDLTNLTKAATSIIPLFALAQGGAVNYANPYQGFAEGGDAGFGAGEPTEAERMRGLELLRARMAPKPDFNNTFAADYAPTQERAPVRVPITGGRQMPAPAPEPTGLAAISPAAAELAEKNKREMLASPLYAPYKAPYGEMDHTKDVSRNFAKSPWMALIAAGAGMMSGTSPYAGVNIGKGLGAGVEYLGKQREASREEESVNQRAKQLGLQADKMLREYTQLTPAQLATAEQSQAALDAKGWQKGGENALTGDLTLFRHRDGKMETGVLKRDGTFIPGGTGAAPAASPATPAATASPVPVQSPVGVVPKPGTTPIPFNEPSLASNLEVPKSDLGYVGKGSPMLGAIKKENDVTLAAQAKAAQQLPAFEQDLAAMKLSYATLMKDSDKDSFLSRIALQPGGNFGERLEAAKRANALSVAAGQRPIFDPDKVAAAENINKIQARMGLTFTAQISPRESFAGQKIGIESTPGLTNSPKGFQRLLAGFEAADMNARDEQRFFNKYLQTNGHALGWRQAFEEQNPAQRYMVRALINQLPENLKAGLPEAVKQLRENPERYKGIFNRVYNDTADFFLKGAI